MIIIIIIINQAGIDGFFQDIKILSLVNNDDNNKIIIIMRKYKTNIPYKYVTIFHRNAIIHKSYKR